MTDEEKKKVRTACAQHGIHYCFVHYSEWNDIEDEAFHKLKKSYIRASVKLWEYFQEKQNITEKVKKKIANSRKKGKSEQP